MGATVEIAILGTEEFRDFVNLFTKEARRKVNIAIVQGAHMIEASAKKYVPVDTGNLKSKITVIKRDEAGRFVGKVTGEQIISEVKVLANTNYAAYLEYGTKKMNAQPYMQPALNENKNKIRAHVVNAVEEAKRSDMRKAYGAGLKFMRGIL